MLHVKHYYDHIHYEVDRVRTPPHQLLTASTLHYILGVITSVFAGDRRNHSTKKAEKKEA